MAINVSNIIDLLEGKNIEYVLADTSSCEFLRPKAWSDLKDDCSLYFYKGNDPDRLRAALDFKSILVLSPWDLKDKFKTGPFLFVRKPQLVFLHILKTFFSVTKSGIHPSAIVHPSAQLGEGVFIGEGAVVGRAIIGAGSAVQSGAVICDNVEIGEDCFINHKAVLGSWAPGSLVDDNGKNIVFPQMGNLTLGSNVFVGTNSILHIGALSDTVIEDDVHIAGNCLIGHNCLLRANAYLAPNVTLAGGVIIGENTYIGIRTVIKENVQIASGITVGMNCQIEQNLAEEGITVMNRPNTKKLGKMFSLKREF